jgi:ATP-dependent protease HslVU (ClpYQ) peptidase subunit
MEGQDGKVFTGHFRLSSRGLTRRRLAMNEDVLTEAVIGLVTADLTGLMIHKHCLGDGATGDQLLEAIKWLTDWHEDSYLQFCAAMDYLDAQRRAIQIEGPDLKGERRMAVQVFLNSVARHRKS